jgi:hypothetical protein
MKGQFGDSVVHVKRTELLDRIKANRETHRAEFEKAWTGYEAAVRAWFEEKIGEIHRGRIPTTTAFTGPVPQDHTDDYDRVIDMLEMEVRTELEIDGQRRTYTERSDYLVNVKAQYEELGRLIAVAEKLQDEYGLGEEIKGGWNSQETWSMDRTKEPPGTQFT